MSETLHACREQIGASADVRENPSRVAFSGSLLLHLGLISFIFFMRPDAALPELAQREVSMAVTRVTYNPQRARPQPPAEVIAEAENPVDEIAAEQPEEVATAEEAGVPAQRPALEQAATPPATAPASGSPASEDEENTATPGVSPAQISNAVATYITTYKTSLTSDWLAACLRYQNEHGVKTCPPGEDGKSETTKAVEETTSRLFTTYVSGAAANIRASKKLLEEMDAARPFLNEDSVMGELARQRYELAEANYCQLNSCRSFAVVTSATPIVTALSFNTLVSNEGRIKLVGFGNGGGSPGILSSLMSFMPGSKSAKPAAVFVPYRFTATPQDQAESTAEFNVEAPLFPVSR